MGTLFYSSLAISVLFADVTYTYRVVERYGAAAEASQTETVHIKSNKLKIERDDKTAQIIDLDQQKIFYLDSSRREYSLVEFEQIKKQLNSKKEDVRAQFAEFSSVESGPSIHGFGLNDPSNESYHHVKRLGTWEDINGRKCETVLIETPQSKITSCAADAVEGQDEFKRVIDLIDLYFGDAAFVQEALSTEKILLDQKLFPVKTVIEFTANAAETFTEEKWLLDINRDELDYAIFEAPKDFRLST